MQSPRNSKERNDDGGDDDNDDITSNCSLFAEMVSWVISAAWFQVTQGPSRSIKLAPIDRSLTTYVCRYN